MSSFACSFAKTPKMEEGNDRFIFWWMVGAHALAVAGLFYFSWANFGVFLAMWFLTTCIGITLGFHRLLAHRSFKAKKWVERVTATCGVLALQGGPLEWVAHHRMHHSFTDTEDDPHNARRSFWHAHMAWLFLIVPRFDDPAVMKRYGRDITADPYLRWLQNGFVQIGLQLAVGIAFWIYGGLGMMLWGIFLRLVVGYHFTWFVNSVCHFFGYRRFETGDLSRNCWWVALLTWGEGWHNNHHAFGNIAQSGLRWYEVDITWYIIVALEKLGLAWDVNRPKLRPAIIREAVSFAAAGAGSNGGASGSVMSAPVHARSHHGYSRK